MELTEKNIKNFWKKVDVKGEDECWEWTGAKNRKNGYGNIKINYKKYRSHRISWILANGKIPEKMCVCHSCDNPGCVNPNHLFLGTHQDNMNDMINKNRNKIPDNSGEKSGNHKLTEQEVLEIKSKYKWYVYTYKMLSEEYCVNYRTILDIIHRKTWKHI